jgi:adenosylmethionine-8-amino-7-oxononanoate aminotransferase
MSGLLCAFSVPGAAPGLRISSGRGSIVHDAAGRRYLDAAGGLWNVTHGLANPRILADIREQLERLAYSPLFDGDHPPALRLADRLIALSEGRMNHVYLSTTGSSAVEVALRVARLHHRAKGRPEKARILSLDQGYHGCSWMSLSASGIMHTEISPWEPVLPGFLTIPSPPRESESLMALEDLLGRDADRIACLIVEPVLGAGGIVVPSQAYAEAVTGLCRAHDVILIADEVATGGGRCGAFFASPLCGFAPDVIALSKGLSSGYCPVGATLFADEVIEPIGRAGAPINYGSTQDGNPVACAAALAVLDLVEHDRLSDRARALGCYIRDRLEALRGQTVVNDVRGLGLMIGIELAHHRAGRPLFSETESLEVRRLCREHGLLVYHFRSGISLFPALTIDNADIDDIIDIIFDVVSALI